MKNQIGKIFIIIGILIVGITFYINYKVEKLNSDTIKKYENLNSNNEDIYKLDINKESINNDSNDKSEINNVIGILEIPKINIKVVIQEGTDMKTLKYAVGHFENTQLPGEMGNFAVAGHRAYTYNKFFSSLDKVEIGDELKVFTKDNNYTYKVTSSQVVKPEAVDVLDSDFNKETITLITCTPKYVGSHRLVIKGERV